MATASGDPRYSWPASDELAVEVVRPGRPLVAVGLLPHSNEPLGSAFADVAATVTTGGVGLLGPLDPPPRGGRFALPTDPISYVREGFLAPLADQVEFAHTATPRTLAQFRARHVRRALGRVRPDVVLLVHNDVGAPAPYLYADRVWPAVEQAVDAVAMQHFGGAPLPPVEWTAQLGRRTLAYFPAERIGVIESECAGLFLPQQLGIPTLTVELPIFDWSASPSHVRLTVLDAMGTWIAQGGSHGGDRAALVARVSEAVGAAHAPMIPAAISARTVAAVVSALHRSATAAAIRSSSSSNTARPVAKFSRAQPVAAGS